MKGKSKNIDSVSLLH